MGLETHCCVSRPQVWFFLLSVMTHIHILPGPDDASHVVWAVCMFLIVFCFSITNRLFPNDSAVQLSHPPFARIVGSHVSLRRQDREKKGGDEDIRGPKTTHSFVFGPQVSIFCFFFFYSTDYLQADDIVNTGTPTTPLPPSTNTLSINRCSCSTCSYACLMCLHNKLTLFSPADKPLNGPMSASTRETNYESEPGQ